MGWLNNLAINVKRIAPGDFLSYYTVKVARIKDWRLGLFYVLVVIFTLAYIFWNLVQNESYLSKAPPVAGTISSNVVFPNGFPTTTPGYCGGTGQPQCMFLNTEQISLREGTDESLFIVTHVRVATTRVPPTDCTYLQPTSPSCVAPLPTSTDGIAFTQTYHVANIDSLALTISHSVRAPFSPLFAIGSPSVSLTTFTQASMKGELVLQCGGGGGEGDFQDAAGVDRIPVTAFLGAAGCDEAGKPWTLEATRRAGNGTTAARETLRESGVEISCPILYHNRRTFGQVQTLKYKYVPLVADKLGANIVDVLVNSNGSLTYYTKYGIRITFSYGGSVGQFSLQNLLISIVAGLSLVRFATVIVDGFILFVAKDRKLYRRLKFQQYEVEEANLANGS
ncbi:cytochrome c oxidase subunit 1 [Phlyctochytrium bullatum]|nr:cytochrome c oxidase subunit 1 [Phlyctochytrium bullatum]